MFVTMHTVDGMRDPHFLIGRPFGRRHQTQGLARLYYPLTLLSIAHDITLDVMGVVVLLVAAQIGKSLVVGLEISITKDPASSHEGPLTDRLSGLNEITVGEIIIGRGLHIEPGGNAVGYIGH